MPAPTFVILAAGEGTRMKSKRPKLLHELCGRPLIAWPIEAARQAGASRIVVVDNPKRQLALEGEGIEIAVQDEPRGTGDAVRAAREHIDEGTVVILLGDVPLITAEVLEQLVAKHEDERAGATMLTMELDDPANYGRVVRGADGSVERVVETKSAGDATEQELLIREINTGIFAFDAQVLLQALDELQSDNAQGEYYLPDTIPLVRNNGQKVESLLVDDASVTLGVNDRNDLALVRAHAQRRINQRHARNGVTIVDPTSTYIDVGVTIGQDTTIAPQTSVHGDSTIGEGCTVGPQTTIRDSRIGDENTIVHSYLDQARTADGVSLGPFAYLRPGANIESAAKIGTFVEVKNSNVGPGTKIPHLSYIGDADIGEASNIGAGTITANYDGHSKHRTTIGSRVKGGVDVSLVAPVTVGDDAYTAAGSVITQDVPDGALGVARERQRNISGYASRRESGKMEPERA